MSRAYKLIKAAAGAGVEDTGDDDFANVVLLTVMVLAVTLTIRLLTQEAL